MWKPALVLATLILEQCCPAFFCSAGHRRTYRLIVAADRTRKPKSNDWNLFVTSLIIWRVNMPL